MIKSCRQNGVEIVQTIQNMGSKLRVLHMGRASCYFFLQNVEIVVMFYKYWLHSVMNTPNSYSKFPILNRLNLLLISQTS